MNPVRIPYPTSIPLRSKLPHEISHTKYPSLGPQAYDADMEPSNEMLVDPDDYVTEQPESEKDEVAIINPEQLDNDMDMPDRIRADDCAYSSPPPPPCRCADSSQDDLIKEIVLPPLAEQPPITAEAVHTWHIENWRSLPRREHGPIFEAGGFPW